MPAPKRDITPWELTTNGARQHPGDGGPASPRPRPVGKCLLRLLPPVLDSNETAVLVGQSAYPVGNV